MSVSKRPTVILYGTFWNAIWHTISELLLFEKYKKMVKIANNFQEFIHNVKSTGTYVSTDHNFLYSSTYQLIKGRRCGILKNYVYDGEIKYLETFKINNSNESNHHGTQIEYKY